MISSEIDYVAPGDVEEVLEILESDGDDVTVLAGGMSLVPMMNLGLAAPERLVSLRRVAELQAVREVGDAVVVGAMVRHVGVATEAVVGECAPALAVAASSIGDVQVRNRGTIGGSVCHADPSADYLPALCAHGARIVLESRQTQRRVVDARDFFVDVMWTDRRPGELLTALEVPKLAPGAVAEYIRFARVEGSFAIANAAVVIDPGGRSTLAVGGVTAVPVVIDISECGRDGWTTDSAVAAAELVNEACAGVRDDSVLSAEYRREMARIHARRVVERAVAQLASEAGGSAER